MHPVATPAVPFRPLAVVHVANTCNLHCVFCLEAGRDGRKQPDLTEVRATLAGLRAGGAVDIVFMGAETLLRRDATDVIAAARDAGFRGIITATNGTVLSRPGYLARLVDAGLNGIELSIHGGDAQVADAISGMKGTFLRQGQALDALAAQSLLEITVNTVMCHENAGKLPEVATYVRSRLGVGRPVHFKFIFPHLLGTAWQRAHDVGPLRYADVRLEALAQTLFDSGADFHIDNAPLCVLGEHAARSLKLRAFATNEMYVDRAVDGRSYRDSGFQTDGQIWPTLSCANCTLRPICPGVEEQYARLTGVHELRTSSRSALAVLKTAMALNRRDPGDAQKRLVALQQEARPDHIVVRRQPGVLRLQHPDIDEPLDLSIRAHDDTLQHFARTARFEVTYRPWQRGQAAAHPRVREALRQVVLALTVADALGLGLNEARAHVASAVQGGWTCEWT